MQRALHSFLLRTIYFAVARGTYVPRALFRDSSRALSITYVERVAYTADRAIFRYFSKERERLTGGRGGIQPWDDDPRHSAPRKY